VKRAAAVAVTMAGASAPGQSVPEALLHFPLRPYQPRAAPEPYLPLELEPAPQSIKDAIVRWLDEQL